MPAEFSEMEQSIIKNMMLRKSYKDIAQLLEYDVRDLKRFISAEIEGTDITTWQMKLDERKPVKRARPAREPASETERLRIDQRKADDLKKELKLAAYRIRINNESERKQLRRQPAYKNVVRDYSKMKLVRIDEKTFIYVKPGDDIEAARERYKLQVEKSKAAFIANDVRPEHHKGKKKCARCEKTKRRDEFDNNRSSKDGKQHICKQCYINSNKIRDTEKKENERF